MKYIVTLFWFVVACLVALFTTMNSFFVNLHQPLGSMKVYFPLLLLITLIVGAFLGFCAVVPWVFRLRVQRSSMKAELKRAQKELDNLRTLPLSDTTTV